MSKPAARTFAYGQGKAMTMGHWSRKHFVTKGEHEQWDSFLLRQRPSTMTPELGDGLVVHRGTGGTWEAPMMSQALYYVMSKSDIMQPVKGRAFFGDMKNGAQHRRSDALGKGLDERYQEAAIKAGLTQGMFTWACGLPLDDRDVAMVDSDWEKLTEEFLEGEWADPKSGVRAVLCRGPFEPQKCKPKKFQPIHSNSTRQPYRFHVMTENFRDRETIAKIHYRLRRLAPAACHQKWVDYNPLYNNYLGWAPHYLYKCPPTGGEPLTYKEELAWRAALPHHQSNRIEKLGTDGDAFNQGIVVP
eukprot:Rhum_TRINITY_DN23692_c0_g1::Rhum_TRINITY_DN23692_c0_g1_i1::g.178558::m.178558